MKTISVIVPCYNESGNIEELYSRIKEVFTKIPCKYELIFIDNASFDNSVQIYEKIISQDNNIKALIMSRNFGSSQPSFFAGIKQAAGDAIVLLDGDLQDPPELIIKFFKKWQKGYDVVFGISKKRKGNILRRIGYTCFYRVFRWLSYLDIPLDVGDFCLIDRKIVNILKALKENDVFIRGLRSWAGFKQTGVEYIRDNRFKGKSSISFFENFAWAKKAIVNFSYKPLEYISRIAFISVVISFFAVLTYIYLYFIETNIPKGFSTLIVVMFILSSIQILSLSVIGEYLIRIFQEVKRRPPFIISRTIENKNSEKIENG